VRFSSNEMTERRTFALAIAAILASTLLCGEAVAGTTGMLQGLVTDQRHTPVSGATVTVQSPAQREETTSDASGRFTFTSLAPGKYAITISRSPYRALTSETVAVTAGGATSVVIRIAGVFRNIDGLHVRPKTSLVRPNQGWDEYVIPSSWP
jgi:hypothetical protein